MIQTSSSSSSKKSYDVADEEDEEEMILISKANDASSSSSSSSSSPSTQAKNRAEELKKLPVDLKQKILKRKLSFETICKKVSDQTSDNCTLYATQLHQIFMPNTESVTPLHVLLKSDKWFPNVNNSKFSDPEFKEQMLEFIEKTCIFEYDLDKQMKKMIKYISDNAENKKLSKGREDPSVNGVDHTHLFNIYLSNLNRTRSNHQVLKKRRLEDIGKEALSPSSSSSSHPQITDVESESDSDRDQDEGILDREDEQEDQKEKDDDEEEEEPFIDDPTNVFNELRTSKTSISNSMSQEYTMDSDNEEESRTVISSSMEEDDVQQEEDDDDEEEEEGEQFIIRGDEEDEEPEVEQDGDESEVEF
jgi:hypothetical protein